MKQKEQYYSDLHTHTTASDGQYTPTQLVTLAAQNGLNILAITDHDTMDGLDEGIEAGKRLGITVLRGYCSFCFIVGSFLIFLPRIGCLLCMRYEGLLPF